jgi:hypothetical protein
MLGVLDHFWPPIVPYYSTEDAVRIVNCFITIFTHVTTITLNYFLRCYAFTQLQSYTFVTTITYYTLTLADFSAINYCLELSQTLHLHTSKLPPRSYSANSLLKTQLVELLLKTDSVSPMAFRISPLHGHPENGRYIFELC